MPLTSYTYLVFLFVVTALARAVSGRGREHVLLTASLVFCASWGLGALFVLASVTVFTCFAGRAVAARRRAALPASIIVLVAAFLACKIAALSGVAAVGVSFYTLDCAGYLLDVGQGREQARSLRRFALFPAFFPHLVSGPILRAGEIAPQLVEPRPARLADVLHGVDRVLVGLVKKLVLADRLAPFVERGFAGGAANSAVDGWVLAVAFGLQVYFDFSGYTDIALGSARMLGIALPENFDLPYHAGTPSDFWRRWHMTLSRWFRDYVFFPLSLRAGRRPALRYATLVGVMVLVGLWHGLAPTFVAWGAWHGLLLVAQRLLEGPVSRLPLRLSRATALAGRAATLILVTAAWVLFRADTLAEAGGMLEGMFAIRAARPAYLAGDYLLVALCVFLYFVVEPFVRALSARDPLRTDYRRWTFWLRPLAYGVALAFVFMFDRSNVAFVYLQF